LSVVVIGAGISGIVLARRLHDAGHRVRLLEKSRGVGGRISTRREGNLRFDHGAPFLSAPLPLAAATWRALEADGVVARDGNRWIGTPAMNAMPRWLASALSIRYECTAHSIVTTSAGWRVRLGHVGDDEADVDTGPDADVVVLAIPAPQAVALLTRSASNDSGMTASVTQNLRDSLSHVTMSPCWSIMFAFDHEVTFDALPAFGDDGLSLYPQHTRFARSTQCAWVAHASPAWSAAHLDADASEIEARVSAAIEVALPGTQPSFVRAHRWRFANVMRGLDAQFLWNAEHRIGACGDWGGMDATLDGTSGSERSGVAHAVASGTALGDAIVESAS
jgi:predicted NAD/FAD-dependent oxidoreductase